MKTLDFSYIFTLEDQKKEIFNLHLDSETLKLITTLPPSLPEWVQLDFHQCPHCPLDVKHSPNCPVALNLLGITQRFDQLLSYDYVHIHVDTQDRSISQDTTVQRGLSSLLGLLMATSGCPLMDFFKIMARFHLPFASTEETIWRAISTYMLAHYFLKKENVTFEFDFQNLSDIYTQIQLVNRTMAERLRKACQQDSMVNALILLDLFAKEIVPVIEESLDEIRQYFLPLLNSP